MKPVEICHAVSPVPWAEARNNGFILPPDAPVRTAFLGIPADVSLRSVGPVNTAFIDIAIVGFYYEEHTRLL